MAKDADLQAWRQPIPSPTQPQPLQVLLWMKTSKFVRGWAKNASRTYSRSCPFQTRLEHACAQIDACTNIFHTLQVAGCSRRCRVARTTKILRRSVPTLHGCSVSSACLGAPFLAMMGIAYLAQGSVRGGNRRLGPAPRLPKSHASCGRNLALDSRRGGRGMTLSCFGKSFVHVRTSPCMVGVRLAERAI